MKGAIVYLADDTIIARYVGEQSPSDILAANGYDDTHFCIAVDLADGESVSDYTIQNGQPVLNTTPDTIKDRLADLGRADKLIRAAFLVVLDEINLLRTNAGLPERTPQQLKDAIKAKL